MEGDGQLDVEMGGDVDSLEAIVQDIDSGGKRRRSGRLWRYRWDDSRGGRNMSRCRSLAAIARNQSRNYEEQEKNHGM